MGDRYDSQDEDYEDDQHRAVRHRKTGVKKSTWLDDFLPNNVKESMENPLFSTVQEYLRTQAGFDVARLVWTIAILIPVKKYSVGIVEWLRKNGTNSVKIPVNDQLARDLQVWVKKQPTSSMFSWMPSFKHLEWTHLGWSRRE
jgi:hypothetical protein